MRTWLVVLTVVALSGVAGAEPRERLFISIAKGGSSDPDGLLAAAGRVLGEKSLELVDAKGLVPHGVGLIAVQLAAPPAGSSKRFAERHRQAEAACASRVPADRKAMAQSQQAYAMSVLTHCVRKASEALFLEAAREASATRAVIVHVEATKSARSLVVAVVDAKSGREVRKSQALGSDDTEAAVLERLLSELLSNPIAAEGPPALAVELPKAATPGSAQFGYFARQDAESLPPPEGCASLPSALEIVPAKDPLGLTLAAQWAKTAALAPKRTPRVRCSLASFEEEGGALLAGAKSQEFLLTCKGAATITGVIPDVLLIKREKQPTEAVVGKKLIAGLLQAYCRKP